MFSFFRRNKKTRPSRPSAQKRRFVRRLPLSLEVLESRILLSADNWIGGSGNWDTGSNWSLGKAPGNGDSAIINTTSAATITIQSGDNINVQSITTGSNDTLAFTGGALTVTNGTSTLSGALSMSGGSLGATGSGVSLTANGTTTVADASLYAENGASLSLPQMTSYTADGNTFEANGAKSVLDVSALTTTPTIKGNWSINTYNGGTLKLTGLTSLSGNSQGTIFISDSGSSTLDDSNVTTLSGVNANIANDAQVANSWTKLTSSQLTVSGGSYSLSGLTDVDDSNLFVNNGGSLVLPKLVNYTAEGNTFQVQDSNSVLDVSALTTPTIKGNWAINAYNGGTLKLTGLTSLSGNSQGTIFITDSGNSTLDDSNVTTLSGVNANIANDAQVANSWTKLTSSQLTVSGGSYSLSGLTDVDDSNLFVNNGGNLALPNLISYTTDGNTFQSQDSNSVLDVSALTTPTIKGNWAINAYNGGTLKLTGLTSLSGNSEGTIFITDSGNSTLDDSNVTTLSGVNANIANDAKVANSWTKLTSSQLTVSGGSYNLSGLTDVDDSNLFVNNGGSLALPNLISYTAEGNTFQVQDSNSVLDVSALTTPTIKGNWAINAYNGGTLKLTGLTSLSGNSEGTIFITDSGNSTLDDSNVTTLSGVNANIANDAKVANSWTKLTSSQLTVSGGSYSLSELTDVDDSNLFVNNGGNLALPKLVNYTADNNAFQADGSNSILDVSALTTPTINGNWSINAYNGGTLKLTALTSLSSSSKGTVYINDSGSSSLLDSNLATLDGVNANLDGTDTQIANSWTTFSNSQLSITGGSSTLAGLTDVDGSSLYVSNGGSLTLSGLANYNAGTSSTTFQADGTGSVLDLSVLSHVQAQPGQWNVNSTNGGKVILGKLSPAFTAYTPPVAGFGVAYSYQFQAFGTEPITFSATGLPAWASLDSSTGVLSGTPNAAGSFHFSVTASNGVVPDATVNVTLVVAGGNATVFNVAAGQTLDLSQDGTYTGGTTFNVAAGGVVNIEAGTFIGGMTFKLDAGAIVNLEAGSYAGTLTGTGSGTVQINSGRLYVGNGGLTLNFSGNMLQWTGGVIDAGNGNVTNQGVLNLSGDDDKHFYNDGVLDNFGTIIQTGAGNLVLGTDEIFPTILKIEAGASYLLESDSGIGQINDTDTTNGNPSILNEGTIRKTAGNGTSLLNTSQIGYLSNTGVIEADSGTLDLEPYSITQLSGNSLTGGTWNAMNGATLQLPSGTSITSNAGNISLDGNGATIAAIAGLASNSGSFSLTNGAAFSTAGDLSNSGSLTVGGGSTLTVAGNYTQTAAATLTDQFGGPSSNGQFGIVAAQESATLAGTFNVSLANGFSPARGAVYPVMTFAGSTGAFATFTGLGSILSEQLNPTALDLQSGTGASVSLQLSQVTAPTTATTGQQITVNWTVNNSGSTAANGSWQDSVYLSTTQSITGSSILLGSVTHKGGLAASGSYNASLPAAIPALPPGNYYVLVQTDSLDQVLVTNRAKDILAASTGQLAVSVPALTLGTPANGTFTAANQDQYYQITVPAGGALSFALQSTASSGALALYLSEGTPPTPYNYQQAAAVSNQPNQTLTVPQVFTAGTYYILVHSISGAAATAEFTLTANQSSALAVNAISLSSAGNAGNATIEIDGSNFLPTASASLTLGNQTINASSIIFVNASQIFTTFNLTGAATGSYTVKVQQGAQTAAAATPFHVVPSTPANPLQLVLNTPSAVRAGREGIVSVTVTNTGNNDVAAPLLVLSSDGATLNLPSDTAFKAASLSFLATSPSGPAGILTPGESVTVTIDFQSTTSNPTINFQLGQADGAQPFNWSQIASLLSQNDASLPNASAALTYMENEVGSTWDGFVAMLDRNASLIPPQLGNPNDVKALFSIEFDKALAAVNTSLSGSLQSPQPGVVVAGRTIYAIDTVNGARYATTVLNDGSFVFSTLAPSTYTFSVDGLLLTSPPTVTLKAGQSLTGVSLAATEGAQISGQVLAQASNTPIVGAAIQATNETSGQGFNVTADADGNYLLSGLPAGVYDLLINATGYAQAEILGVEVSQANAVEPVDLSAQSSISGTIALKSGGPSETALLVAASISGSEDANQTFSSTSTTSNFDLTGLPAGTYNVTLSLPGYITQTIASVVVAAGQAVNLGTITFSPASEIDGSVTSTDPNNPAAEILVQALQNGNVVAGALTDASGNYQLTNLAPGTYTLAAPSAAFVTAPTVTVGLGQTVTGESIQVQPGGAISGTVTDLNTNPLAGVPVYLSGPSGLSDSTTTDSNGRYQFSGLATGSYQVYLLLGGKQTSQTVSVTSLVGGAVTANLQFGYSATITGALTDSSGNPITDGIVTLYQSGSAVANALTNASGIYTFLILQPGTFDLAAAASEGTFTVATGIAVSTGSSMTQNFQVGSGSLSITATDGSQTVAGDSVALESLVDGTLTFVGQTTVAADSTASFSNLAAGSYTVVVTGNNGDFGQTTVSITTGGSANTTVLLVPQASVSGTITDSSGTPLSGATVLFQLSTNLQQGSSAVTATDGTYSITSLPPGTYDVTVFSNGYQATMQTGLTVSTSATINAALKASTTTISGKLVDSSGNPVPAGMVTVTDAVGHVLGIAEVNPDGTFAVTSAQGNGLALQVIAEGYAPVSPVSFNAPVGIATQLNPIVLSVVAIDPSGPGLIGGQSQVYWPSDGQSWADQLYQQGSDILAKATGGLFGLQSPTCPNCIPAYNAAQNAQTAYLKALAKLTDQGAEMLNQCFVVDGFVVAESAVVYAKVQAALALVNAFGFALSWVTAAGSAYEVGAGVGGAVVLARELKEHLEKYNEHAHLMPSESSEGGIEENNGNVQQDVANLAKDAAELTKLQQEQIAPEMILLQRANGTYRMFPKELLIEKLEVVSKSAVVISQLVGSLSNNPFSNTVSAARTLNKMWNNFNNVLVPNWQKALSKAVDTKEAYDICESQPCQPDPSPKPGPHRSTPNDLPEDPNALIGPAGSGPQGFILPGAGALPYTVDFENDGSAAAQDVTVTEQLDPNLNWSTFQLGSIGFGSVNIVVPAGLTQYQTTVHYQNTDGSSLDVKVSLNFNVQTGLLTATFTSIDPATGQAPSGVFDGFLPPDNNTHIGEGFVQYTVQPKSGLAAGATIGGQASVIFDTNAAIQTNTVTNTIDAVLPTSSVHPLPATVTSPNFSVSWSGSDPGGPGVASYNVYVSDNGGAFTPWLTNTTQTSATYNGQDGHHYSFYSVASDPLGLPQPTPSGAQATTYVFVPPSPPPPPPPHPTLQVPPLLAFFDSLLGGVETFNANGTETITDSIFGIPLIVANFDGTGKLTEATLFGINVTFLFELL